MPEFSLARTFRNRGLLLQTGSQFSNSAELSDFDKKNEFDVECYLKHELRLLTTEEFDLYEVDVTEQAQG